MQSEEKPKAPSLEVLKFFLGFANEHRIIAGDARENRERLKTSDSPTNRRNYVRSLFALFELEESVLRSKAWDQVKAQRPRLDGKTIERANLLPEDEFRIQSGGRVQRLQRRIGFLDSFAYSIKTLKDLRNCHEDFLGGRGWEAMRESKKIRDRITRPRGRSVEISEDDLAKLEEAAEWLDWVKESFPD